MEFTTHLVLQSQATRLEGNNPYAYNKQTIHHEQDSHLFSCLVPKDLSRSYRLDTCSHRIQLVDWIKDDFHCELFPLHSPLLGESRLVSFPLLSYMLKFRRSSFQFEVWRVLKWFLWINISDVLCHFYAQNNNYAHFISQFHSHHLNKTREWLKNTNTQTGILPLARKCNVHSKIRWSLILQFTSPIAFRCVLHRYENQDIHRYKSFIFVSYDLSS